MTGCFTCQSVFSCHCVGGSLTEWAAMCTRHLKFSQRSGRVRLSTSYLFMNVYFCTFLWVPSEVSASCWYYESLWRNVPSWIWALSVDWVQIYRLCVYTEHPDHKNFGFPHSCLERFGFGPPNISRWDSRVGLLSKKGDSVLTQDLDPLLFLLGS